MDSPAVVSPGDGKGGRGRKADSEAARTLQGGAAKPIVSSLDEVTSENTATTATARNVADSASVGTQDILSSLADTSVDSDAHGCIPAVSGSDSGIRAATPAAETHAKESRPRPCTHTPTHTHASGAQRGPSSTRLQDMTMVRWFWVVLVPRVLRWIRRSCRDDVVVLWEHVWACRIVVWIVAGSSLVHYLVIFCMRQWATGGQLRSEIGVVLFYLACSSVGLTKMYYWKNQTAAARKMWTMILASLYHVLPLTNIVMNSQKGRPSQAALWDSFMFCMAQFVFNRSHLCRAIFNFISCFSWHFSKRLFSDLKSERGTNLQHLLTAILIYASSLYVSFEIQPHIERELLRSQSLERAM